MKNHTLRVWHIPNPPREPYCVPVANTAEAIRVLRIIADYDLYLGDLIFANAQGLERLTDNGDWEEWEDEETYDDIRALADALDQEPGRSSHDSASQDN